MTGALTVLVGAAGSGKSTLAAARPLGLGELVRADEIRGRLTGTEARYGGHPDPTEEQRRRDVETERRVWSVIDVTLDTRLMCGLPTLLDSTGGPAARRRALGLAARHGAPPVVFEVLDTPLEVCLERNAARERVVPPAVVRAQWEETQRVRAGDWWPPESGMRARYGVRVREFDMAAWSTLSVSVVVVDGGAVHPSDLRV